PVVEQQVLAECRAHGVAGQGADVRVGANGDGVVTAAVGDDGRAGTRASLEGAGILDVDISAGAAAVERAVGLLEPALSEDAVRAGACGVDVGIQVHADGPAGSLRSAALVQAPLDRRQNTVDRVLVVAE